jgi:DAACS family dicarboxylate/amino acid:cation (Na+ or H+) symporter
VPVLGGLSTRMLLGLVVGAALGLAAHLLLAGSPPLEAFVAHVTEPLGRLFLRCLFMLVLPLVVSALALGVAGLGDVRTVGRVGLRTLVFTTLFSGAAVGIGVALVNFFEPGAGLDPETRERLRSAAAPGPAAAPIGRGIDVLVNLVPQNVVRALADGDMLAVMVFALFLGAGIAATPSPPVERFREALEGLYEISMRLLGFVIRSAPIGVFCLVFTLTARIGHELLALLGAYVAVVLGALALQQFAVYPLALATLGGVRPRGFFAAVQPAMLMAFSTASSNATLPTALRVADEGLGLPQRVSRFVLTLGSTANQNGTALFEGVTVLFLAQFFGVELDLGQQFVVVGICILGGIGTAGVPAGSLPVIAAILAMVGVPAEGIGMILGVDRLLDMCRTAINVTGDLAIAVLVSRGEGEAGPA